MSKTGYDEKLDKRRLDDQLHEILAVMLHAGKTGTWLTLREIWQLTKHGESSISAQLRNLRKPRYGNYLVEKRRRGEPRNGCWEYKCTKPVLDNRVGELFPASATQERA